MKAHFTGLRLVAGDVLTVADPTGAESYHHAADVTASGTAFPDATGCWAMSAWWACAAGTADRPTRPAG